MDNQFQVEHKTQKSENDCGPTCLDMLGYDGYSLISRNEQRNGTSMNLASRIRNVRICCHYTTEPDFAYELPHLLSVFFPWQINMGHWVVRHRDRIYCPSFGIKDAKEYLNGVLSIAAEFMIPFHNQQITSEDLEAETKKEKSMINQEFLFHHRKVKFLEFYDPFEGMEFAPGVERPLLKNFRVLYLDAPKEPWDPQKDTEAEYPHNLIKNLIPKQH